jgi:ABC-type transport system substrate-binding protein
MALVAGACGSSSSGGGSADSVPEGTPVDGGSLVIGVTTETAGWNPHYTSPAESTSFILASMLEPLASTGADLNAQPFLATSWTPNATFDSWTVKLRDGVVFHNGEKLDATAAKASIDDGVNGGVSGQAVRGLFKGVTVVDPLTLQIELTQPWAAFPNSFLDSQIAVMIAPASLATPDHGGAHPVGTGPFEFESWEPGTSITVKKNDTYWQAGQPHLDQIVFKVIPDNSSRAAALQTGDLNMMMTTSASDATSLAGQYQVIKAWHTEPEMIALNTSSDLGGETNPMADVHARRALAYATDRQAVAAVVGEGVDSPTSPFAPDSPWGRPEDQNNYPEHDVDQAKAEVEAYKTDTGESSLHVTLTSADRPARAEPVAGSRHRRDHRGGRGLGADRPARQRQVRGVDPPDLQRPGPGSVPLLLVGRHHRGLRRDQHQPDAVLQRGHGGGHHDRTGEREHRHPQGRLRPGRRPDQRAGDQHLAVLEPLLADRRQERPRSRRGSSGPVHLLEPEDVVR